MRSRVGQVSSFSLLSSRSTPSSWRRLWSAIHPSCGGGAVRRHTPAVPLVSSLHSPQGAVMLMHQHASDGASSPYPKDVGIVAMDVYFPSTYVAQKDLGTHRALMIIVRCTWLMTVLQRNLMASMSASTPSVWARGTWLCAGIGRTSILFA